jgi:hypothetical protein
VKDSREPSVLHELPHIENAGKAEIFIIRIVLGIVHKVLLEKVKFR